MRCIIMHFLLTFDFVLTNERSEVKTARRLDTLAINPVGCITQ